MIRRLLRVLRERRRPRAAEPLILTLLRAGNTREAAAAGAKINPATLYAWLAGKPRFREAVEEAEHAAEVLFASRIRKAATEAEIAEHFDRDGNLLTRRTKYDWKAAAWWLERRRRETWKPTTGVEVSGPDGAPIPHEVTHVGLPDPDDIDHFARFLRAMAESGLIPDLGTAGVVVDGSAAEVDAVHPALPAPETTGVPPPR